MRSITQIFCHKIFSLGFFSKISAIAFGPLSFYWVWKFLKLEFSWIFCVLFAWTNFCGTNWSLFLTYQFFVKNFFCRFFSPINIFNFHVQNFWNSFLLDQSLKTFDSLSFLINKLFQNICHNSLFSISLFSL